MGWGLPLLPFKPYPAEGRAKRAPEIEQADEPEPQPEREDATANADTPEALPSADE